MTSSIFSILAVLSLLSLLDFFPKTFSLQTQYGFKRISCYRNGYIRSYISLIAANNDGVQLDFGREDDNQETERTEDNSLSSLRAQLNEKDQGVVNDLEKVNNEREDNNQEIERAEDNSLSSLRAQLNNDVVIEEIDFEKEHNNREIERTVNNSLDSIRAQLAKENSEEIVKSLLPKCYVIISNLQSGNNIGTIFLNIFIYSKSLLPPLPIHSLVVVMYNSHIFFD